MQTVNVVLLLLAFVVCDTLAVKWGPCPKTSCQANFNVIAYTESLADVWFEMFRSSNAKEDDKVCVTAAYYTKSNGHYYVNNTAVSCGDHEYERQIGDAAVDGAKAQLGIKFHWWQRRTPYTIIWTDYENALVYACQDYLLLHVDTTWVMSRSPAKGNMTEWERLRVMAVEEGLVDVATDLVYTLQEDCYTTQC